MKARLGLSSLVDRTKSHLWNSHTRIEFRQRGRPGGLNEGDFRSRGNGLPHWFPWIARLGANV